MPVKDLEVLSPCIRHIHLALRNSLNSKLSPAIKISQIRRRHGDDGDTLTVT